MYWVEDLSPLPGHQSSTASAINQKGKVVGWLGSTPDLGGPHRACLWDNGVTVDLGVLPGFLSSQAYAINDGDEVVGRCDGPSSVGFIWTAKNGMQPLPPLPNFTDSVAWDINNAGKIVGNSIVVNVEPILQSMVWENRQPVLFEVPDDKYANPPASVALSINDGGVIAGWYGDNLGEGHLFPLVTEGRFLHKR